MQISKNSVYIYIYPYEHVCIYMYAILSKGQGSHNRRWLPPSDTSGIIRVPSCWFFTNPFRKIFPTRQIGFHLPGKTVKKTKIELKPATTQVLEKMAILRKSRLAAGCHMSPSQLEEGNPTLWIPVKSRPKALGNTGWAVKKLVSQKWPVILLNQLSVGKKTRDKFTSKNKKNNTKWPTLPTSSFGKNPMSMNFGNSSSNFWRIPYSITWIKI